MQNYVITITRQFGSRGRDIGVAAAKKLGIPLYDRNVLEKEAEEIDSTLHSLVEFSKNGMSESGYYKMAYPLGIGSALKKDRMFELQSKLVLKHAESENCVIIGRCADHILADVPGVVRVFVHAPEDFCLQEAMKVNSLSVSEVQKLIAQTDEYRAHYYKYYTGQEWKNAQNYDLSLDSSRLGFDGTVEAILSYIEVRKKFDKTM